MTGAIKKIINSRKAIIVKHTDISQHRLEAAEGGCGVIGVASTTKLKGKYFFDALIQMKNRGNGKGGGVAVLGLSPEQLKISQEELKKRYILQIAFLDETVVEEVEKESLEPFLEVSKSYWVETIENPEEIGLETTPPRVKRYFCSVKKNFRDRFIQEHQLKDLPIEKIEEEIMFQVTYALNNKYYASLGEKKAFVLSAGKNIVVFKLVGYAHEVIKYYKLENFEGNIWIGHHRYPTKGRVWHPGGAHPFVSVNSALVHNGDFSNYYSITQYLKQKQIEPLFLTDTEVAIYLFDLWRRVYEYPLEYVIEAMAPTTERDFKLLPEEKQIKYQAIQTKHFHGSPDGPWFFIIGDSNPTDEQIELIGITDTSMLRPQVFALQENREATIGLVASERQAIDAFLASLSKEDSRFYAKADKYWVARGGSHTDGGAFVFTIKNVFDKENRRLVCTNKFGDKISVVKPTDKALIPLNAFNKVRDFPEELKKHIAEAKTLEELLSLIEERNRDNPGKAIEHLTLLLDRLHLSSYNNVGWARAKIEEKLFSIFRSLPLVGSNDRSEVYLIDWANRKRLTSPSEPGVSLAIDMKDFPAEGPESAARMIVEAYKKGWNRIFTFDWKGQRFCCSGLGPNTDGLRIEVYGNPGDYLGSGLDGAEVYVHCSAQDQVGQIMRKGKLVIYGDVGQAFLYGAKGGEIFVLGSTAGRPLINAVGKPRVIINGTSLDYLAESFMAGNPLKGGGFVIVNAIEFDEKGRIVEMDTPYPGSNLFSLASGGAIYIRDPKNMVEKDQLNGGDIFILGEKDKQLLKEFLAKNKQLFGIELTDLENVDDEETLFASYKKIAPIKLEVLK